MPDLKDCPRGNVTIVFTDVEKSTNLTSWLERAGKVGVYEANLQKPQQDRLKAQAESRRGVEIQRVGDSQMFVFQTAGEALDCVVAHQRSLKAEPIIHREGDQTLSISIRLGVHTVDLQREPEVNGIGQVVYPGGDTNFAHRVMSLAAGGQVLISEDTAKQARTREEYRPLLYPWPGRALRGVDHRAHDLFEILYDPARGPIEPGLRWLPDWYRSEKRNLYVDRPGKEKEVVAHFLRKPPERADAYRGRSGPVAGPRIVTIVGPGGMGKTRLAVACAAKVADLFEHGVFLVDLAFVDATERAVAQAIGVELGRPRESRDPDAVLDHLRSKNLLLVLDNFEAVAPEDEENLEVQYLLNRIVGQAHDVRMLVASRSPVDITDIERMVRLEDGMDDNEALALFLDRARLQWGEDRDLTADEEPCWIRIRKATDRIPLAIELAAAWVGEGEGLDEIAAGLEESHLSRKTGLPRGKSRHDSEKTKRRHDSLTRSLDWSYNLIGKKAGPKVQALLATCGLFATSFDAPTVAAIAADPLAGDGLGRLYRISLIRRDQSGYTLHRSTREYALRRFDDLSTAEETRRRFMAHYADLVNRHVTEPVNLAGCLVLDQEWPNALAASQVAEDLADGSYSLSMFELGHYFQFRGLWSDAEKLYLRSLAHVRSTSNQQGEGVILNNLGNVYRAQGRYDEALDAYAGSLAICREFKDRVGEGRTLGNPALLSEVQGRLPEAIAWAREAVGVLETTEAHAACARARQRLERLEQIPPG